MKKNRPYKYNSKSRLTPNSQSFPFKVNSIKNDVKTNLENTLTKLRIVEEPAQETETLDNSFLEGRFEEDKKKKKERKAISKEEFLEKVAFFKRLFLSVSAVCALILVILFASHFIREGFSNIYHSARERIVVSDKNSPNMVDDNYLFVGDFHTNQLSFDKLGLDYHYVKVSTNTLTTSELLSNMKSMVYDYNPSIIFIEVGIMDLDQGTSTEEYIHNYRKIIDLIQSNRPNAIIYIESIYPINKSVSGYDDSLFERKITNTDINLLNSSLKSLAKDENVFYIDVNAVLSKKGDLNEDYTNDGVTLNEKGYQEFYKEIKKVVG